MKNLLVGMVLLGSAALLSHAHAAEPLSGSKNARFIKLSSDNGVGGVYSLQRSGKSRYIEMDNVTRHKTKAAPIALRDAVQRAPGMSLDTAKSADLELKAVPRKLPTPLALQPRSHVNARREAPKETEALAIVKPAPVEVQAATIQKPEPLPQAYVATPRAPMRKVAVPPLDMKPVAKLAEKKEAIDPLLIAPSPSELKLVKPRAVAKAALTPVVKEAAPQLTLDKAFAAVEQNVPASKPELVAAKPTAKPEPEIVVAALPQPKPELVATRQEHVQAVPVTEVQVVDVTPVAKPEIVEKVSATPELKPEPTEVKQAALKNTLEPWEVTREITAKERDRMVAQSVELAEKKKAAPASEQIAVVSLDDEYLPESVTDHILAVPTSKPEAPERFGVAFQWPVRQSEQKISSNFGSRKHPITGKRHFHTGIDIPANRGTTIMAAADGEVIEVGRHPRLGKYVKIDHGDKLYSIYGHMDRYVVRKGRKVKAGQRIGAVGSTGRSTGPHLHFTIRQDEKLMDPMMVLRDSANANSLALVK